MQTNEVRRSWTLLPCFLEAARRVGAETLDLVELGSSAGFNLLWDRYRYRYAAGRWGPSDALLELDGEERAPVPGGLLRREPPELVRRDLVDVLPRLLDERADDALTVVFLTAVLGYLGDDGWEQTRFALQTAGRGGGLAFLWTARPAEDVHSHWGLWLQLWPGGEPEVLAHADFHGAWREWLA